MRALCVGVRAICTKEGTELQSDMDSGLLLEQI